MQQMERTFTINSQSVTVFPLPESRSMEWSSRSIFGSGYKHIKRGLMEHQPQPPAVVELSVEARPVGNSIDMLRSLWWKLRESDTSITGVYGPAGIGKTTFMKTFNNSLSHKNTQGFDIVIFATVSRQHPLASVQTAILKRLGLPWQGRQGTWKRAARIAVALEGKRCLLLLDDILAPFDLKSIGLRLSGADNNNKIILATRSDGVCRKMGATSTLGLKPLDEQRAWELFTRHTGDRPDSTRQEIHSVAKDIAQLCEGFPLALVTVGRAMSFARSLNQWDQGLKDLNLVNMKQSSIDLEMAPIPVLSAFRFMYEKAVDYESRDCLDCFTLFSKNSSINKRELIRIWFGEGILRVPEFGSMDSVFSHGHKIIKRLKKIGMLMDGEDPDTEVMIQDLVHDLILDMKQDKFIVNKWVTHKSIEKISLMQRDMESLQSPSTNLTNLKSLILARNIYLKRIDSEDFFRDTPVLRFLDLSRTDITTIPNSIGELSQLRHLDLSFTKIKSLPPVMKKLKNLVQLILEGTRSLTLIPDGLLCELTQVVVVNLYDSLASGSKEMHDLEKLEHLKELGIAISSKSAWATFSESQALHDSTARLLLKDCEHLEHVLVPSCKGNLKVVSIWDCRNLEDIQIEDGNNVEELQLKGLYQLRNAWTEHLSFPSFPMLQRLDISYCHELKDVTWVLDLESLESINIESCKKMEQIIRKKDVQWSTNMIKRLKKVTLRYLPKLSHLWGDSLYLPNLTYVMVLQCPQLWNLPAEIKGAGTVEIHGELDWWNALKATSNHWIFQSAESSV